MFLASLARIVGVIAFFAFAVGVIVSLAAQNFVTLAISGVLGAGAVAVAMAGDRALNRRKAALLAEARSDAEPFTGGEFKVGVRWFKWFFLMLLAGGIAALMGLAVLVMWGKRAYLPALLTGFGAVTCAMFALTFLRQGFVALQAGYLMHLDLLGLRHAQLDTIAWKHVLGVDLHEMVVKGQTHWHLKFALDPGRFDALRPAAWRRWIDWAMPKFDAKRKVMTVGLAVADCRPGELLAVARSIADRAGGRRIKDWAHYEDVELALARVAAQARADQAQKDLDALLARVKAMPDHLANDPEQIRKIDEQAKQAFDRMSSASSEALDARIVTVEKTHKEVARQMRWAHVVLWISLGVTLVAIGLKLMARLA